MNIYKRRSGLEWDNILYNNLLNYLIQNNLSLEKISDSSLTNLSNHIYPKFGYRRHYREVVLFFIENYATQIYEDYEKLKALKVKEPTAEINAPKLSSWLEYMQRLIVAMSQINTGGIELFLKNDKYTFPIDIKKKLLNDTVLHDKIDKREIKILNNTLLRNRKEICEGIEEFVFGTRKKKIANDLIFTQNFSHRDSENFEKDKPFHGFTKNDIEESNIMSKVMSSHITDINSIPKNCTDTKQHKIKKKK